MSRVPPVKLPQSIMRKMATLPPSAAGRVLIWGWRCYQGETLFLDEEERRDPTMRDSLYLCADLLDSTSLALGIIDVTAFTAARLKDEDLSRKRAEAREARFSEERQAERETNVVPMKRYANGTEQVSQGTNRDHPCDTPEGRISFNNLLSIGLEQPNARLLVEKFTREYGSEALLSVTGKMKGRRVANPERYLSQALSNQRSDRIPNTELNPAAGPRPVQRQIAARKDGAWDFLGWTCRDHPRAAKGVQGRLKVWRTDAGRLSYKKPTKTETPPGFDKDAGIMEVE